MANTNTQGLQVVPPNLNRVQRQFIPATQTTVALGVSASGTTYLCTPSGNNQTITLPSPIGNAGVNYKFIKIAGGNQLTVSSNAANLTGFVNGGGNYASAAGKTSVTLQAGVAGEFITVVSDNTNYVIYAAAKGGTIGLA